jgi:hypothetical protein
MYLRIESNRQIDHHRTAPLRLRIPVEPQKRRARLCGIVASPDRDSPELSLEFAKLPLGPDATASD